MPVGWAQHRINPRRNGERQEKNWNGTFNKNRLPLIEWVAQWSIQWLSGSKLQFYICFFFPHSVVNWCAVPVRRDINLLMIYDCRFWKCFDQWDFFPNSFFTSSISGYLSCAESSYRSISQFYLFLYSLMFVGPTQLKK